MYDGQVVMKQEGEKNLWKGRCEEKRKRIRKKKCRKLEIGNKGKNYEQKIIRKWEAEIKGEIYALCKHCQGPNFLKNPLLLWIMI